jgi:Protein-disulfide isomerase
MSKKAWAILIAVILLFGAFIWFSVSRDAVDYSDIDENSIIAAEDRNGNIADHLLGDPNAMLTLIEYGDYQCPGCASASSRINAIVNDYEGKINLIFRNFPIPSLHPNGRAASAAAEAAGLQGKYWEMNDLLYKNQIAWENASVTERDEKFANLAETIGMDKQRFQEDLKLSSISQKINFDIAIAKKHNVSGTPAFFVNGERIDHSIISDDELLRNFIDQKLAEKN